MIESRVILVLVVLVTTGFVVFYTIDKTSYAVKHVRKEYVYKETRPNYCTSLTDIVNGKWILKEGLTPEDYKKREEIEIKLRRAIDWPDSVFHPQHKCGRTAVLPHSLQGQCDKFSDKPCCNYGMGMCGNTTKHCNCGAQCRDFRDYGPAELYNWTPHSGCKVRYFKPEEMCDTMNNNRIQLIFTGDHEKGSQPKHLPENLRKACSGDLQISTWHCFSKPPVRKLSDLIVYPDGLCNGVHKFAFDYIQDWGTSFMEEVDKKWDYFIDKPNTWIVAGVGLAYYTNYERAEKAYFDKVSEKLQKRTNGWPKFIWINMHDLKQFMRMEDAKHQYASAVQSYNAKATAYWTKRNIPIIHTWNFSEYIYTFDGVHYNYGYNELKMNVIFNELQKHYDRYKYV